MLDEQQLRDIALRTSGPDAESAKAKAATRASAASAALDGRRVEVDQATEKHTRFAQQRARRASEGAEEKTAHVLNFFKSGSKSPIEIAVAAYSRVAAEDLFLHDVLTLSQQAIDASRERVRIAEIDAMKMDLRYQEASVISLAVAHLAAAAHITETDPDIVVEFGPKIVETLDNIANQTVQLAERERGTV